MIERILQGEACGMWYSHPMVQAALGDLHPGGTDLTRTMARQAKLAPGMHVLDMGCGTGTSARLLASEFGVHVTAVDADAKQIAQAKPHERVTFLCQATVPLGPFDAILSECALCLMDADTMATFWLRLRPDGVLLLSDVTLESTAVALQTPLAFVACIAGAKPLQATLEQVESAGFAVAWQECRSDWVQAVRDRIHSRVHVAAVLEMLQEPTLNQLVDAAQEALDKGELRYLGMVATKQSTTKSDDLSPQ